jgi:F-type H+-transporting ATPase subunit d
MKKAALHITSAGIVRQTQLSIFWLPVMTKNRQAPRRRPAGEVQHPYQTTSLSPPQPQPIHHNGCRSTLPHLPLPLSSYPKLNCPPRGCGQAAIAPLRSSPAELTRPPPQRSAALKLDWTKLASQLGLKGSTASALAAFKKRNDDARRKVTVLSEQPQTVDFAHYRSILKNTAIVDEIEKSFNGFKPATYDVGRQIKAIEAFEVKAVESAEETSQVVQRELRDLEKTLKNIEEARPFEDLTVVCIAR